jgi:hypothetical protein
MPGCTVGSVPAGVVLLQGEDNVAATVKPSLLAAGADIDRVFVYDPTQFKGSPLTLPDDLPLVQNAVEEVEAKLLIIDPAASFFKCNPNSDTDVRKALAPLDELAKEEDLAVLIVRHLRKANSGNILYRASGSIQWVAFARSALRAIDDPFSSSPNTHVIIPIKSNLPSATSLRYRTKLVGETIQLEWLGASGINAKDLSEKASDASKVWEAAEVLFNILRNGPFRSQYVYEKAKAEGVAKKTLERAKDLLGAKSGRKQDKYSWWWEWYLPPEENEILTCIRQKYAAMDAEQADTAVGLTSS